MKRREFIAVIGAAVAMPLTARAQRAQARVATFVQEMQRLGWTDGRNLQVDYRWDTGDPSYSKAATELVTRSPDVILATGTPAVAALQQATRTVPIVFWLPIPLAPASQAATLPGSQISTTRSVQNGWNF